MLDLSTALAVQALVDLKDIRISIGWTSRDVERPRRLTFCAFSLARDMANLDLSRKKRPLK